MFRDTHIVSIRVLDQCEGVVGNLVHELNTLVIGSMVDASLQNTTPVAVSSNFNAISGDGVVDKLQRKKVNTMNMRTMSHVYLVVLRSELVETFLNDMVAVEVLDEHNNMEAECNDNGVNLNIVSLISLNSTVSLAEKYKVNLTCLSSSGQEVDHFLYSTSSMHIQ